MDTLRDFEIRKQLGAKCLFTNDDGEPTLGGRVRTLLRWPKTHTHLSISISKERLQVRFYSLLYVVRTNRIRWPIIKDSQRSNETSRHKIAAY